MNAAPLPGSAGSRTRSPLHRPAQLARDVEPEAAALVGRPRRRRARSAGTAGRDPPRATPAPWSAMVIARGRRPRHRPRSSTAIARPAAVLRRRCRGAPTGPGRAGRASARASQPAEPVVERERHVRRRRAPPTPAGRAAAGATTSSRGRSAPDSSRVTVSSWRTIRDSRSACSVMIPRRRSGVSAAELLGVAADARERRLEVVADAAQEVVLRRVELESCGFWASTWANSWALRIAAATSLANSSSRSWSARSQRRVAGRCPTTTPSSSPAGDEVGADGHRIAGDALLDGDRRAGRRGARAQSIIPNAPRAPGRRPGATNASGRSSQADRLERAEDPAQLAVPALEVARRGGCGSRRAG